MGDVGDGGTSDVLTGGGLTSGFLAWFFLVSCFAEFQPAWGQGIFCFFDILGSFLSKSKFLVESEAKCLGFW